MADNAGLSAALDGIPMVADAAARDARFPLATRKQNQRVFRLDTGVQERWSGSTWVSDTARVFNVRSFGAVGDGVTDDSPAFGLWATAINSAGGGVGIVPPGTYAIAPTKATVASPSTATPLCAFSALAGFHLIAAGATFMDTNTYGSGPDQEAIFLSFTNCTRVDLGAIKVTTPTYAPYTTAKGLIVTRFLQGCRGVRGHLAVTGGQKGVLFNREYADPTSYSSSDIDLSVVATGTQYPLLCRWSGDNLRAAIDGTGCGRNYFAFGVANHRVTVRSTNQTGATIIGAFSGLGCTDVDLTYVDTTSTTGTTANEAILLQFSDQTAATFRNIAVHLDVVNPPAAPFLTTFAVNKVDNLGASDTTGRGHVIDGLRVDGYSAQVNGVNHVQMSGTSAMASPDVVRGVDVSGLRQTSTGTSLVVLSNLLAPAALTYSAAMTPDMSNGMRTVVPITATNGTAFTINAPTGRATDKLLTLTIRNTSGGALGTATFNAVYKMAAWTQPATGFSRSITFRDDGTNLVEVSRTPADVPN